MGGTGTAEMSVARYGIHPVLPETRSKWMAEYDRSNGIPAEEPCQHQVRERVAEDRLRQATIQSAGRTVWKVLDKGPHGGDGSADVKGSARVDLCDQDGARDRRLEQETLELRGLEILVQRKEQSRSTWRENTKNSKGVTGSATQHRRGGACWGMGRKRGAGGEGRGGRPHQRRGERPLTSHAWSCSDCRGKCSRCRLQGRQC